MRDAIHRRLSAAWTRRTICAFVGALLAAAAAAPATGQISPGPLSAAHASLDSNRGCLECHGAGDRDLDRRCLECHLEIAERIGAATGLHGRERFEACASCHPEHGGRGFELIEWSEGSAEGFDHARAGWQLVGRHAETRCRRCHAPENLEERGRRSPGRVRPARTWLGLDPACATCHEDVHARALGESCDRCHDARAFKPAPGFDHQTAAYPLTGKHAEVACERCHLVPGRAEVVLAQGRVAPLYRPLPHGECSDCHADVHAGALGPVCADCHVTASFRTVDRDRFDHRRTRYPLEGAHQRVACGKCHDAERAWGAQPRFQACADCHEDVHRGQATLAGRAADCAACHTVTAFRPSRFTVAMHAESAYPLEDKHAEVACRACHGAAAGGSSEPALRFRLPFDRCDRCHRDAHGGQLSAEVFRTGGAPSSAGGDCASCHGADGWRPSSFDATRHAQLRLGLTGRHARIECAACHGTKGVQSASSAAVRLRPVDPACQACHVDPHGGRPLFRDSAPPADCVRCHDSESFRRSRVDPDLHASLGYPLEGAHRTVPCIACHEALAAGPPESTLLGAAVAPLDLTRVHGRCEDCHEGPHTEQFSARLEARSCDSCHAVQSWRPAGEFDHDRDTSFALGSAHRTVACGNCHVSGADGASVRYTEAPGRCEDCHRARGEVG